MTVALVDYGVGNILSVARAVRAVTSDLVVTADRDAIAKASHVIVPGVGSFGACVERLDAHDLRDPLIEMSQAGRPILGICVGMQMLLETSDEFGHHEGLGLVPGRVTRIDPVGADGEPVKIPHIGWSALGHPQDRDGAPDPWAGTVLDAVTPGDHVYFLHSFAAYPADPAHRLAETRYGGRPVAAAVRVRQTVGLQFHPEKSGEAGLAVLRRFASLPAHGS